MQRFRCCLGLAFCLSTLSGCPGAPDVNGTQNDPPAPNADRLASLDHIQQLLAPIELDGSPDKTTQIKDMLSALPDFREVVELAGAVIARFKDGEILVVFNNRANGTNPPGGQTPDQQLDGGISRSIIPDQLKSASADKTSGTTTALDKPALVPESNVAILVNAMGNAYVDSTAVITPWLGNAGYDVHRLDGSVESLRNGVTNVGVMYMNTHGALIPLNMITTPDANITFPQDASIVLPPPRTPFPGSDGKHHFTLWTTTDITDETIAKYRDEVQAGDLYWGIAENDRVDGKVTNARHFIITEAFIRKHWKCKPGALIFMDACSSLTDLIVNVCVGGDVGAACYIGWNRPVWEQYSIPSARFFFDRALGSNKYRPVRTPLQRPFSTNEIFDAMSRVSRLNLPLDAAQDPKGLFIQPSDDDPNIAYLDAAYAAGVADVILRPGIRSLKVNEGNSSSRLIVDGAFGGTPGSVTIGGAAASLAGSGWAADRIECDIAKNASGPVVVSAAGRDSNLRRLSQWNLTLHRLFMDYPTQGGFNCPSCFHEGTVQFTIRADCGTGRLVAEGDVSPPGYTGSAADASIDITNAGGSFFIGQGSTVTLSPNPDDGAQTIGTCVGFNPPANNNYIGACFFLNGSAGSIAFSPTYNAEGLFRSYTGGAFDGIVERYDVTYSGNLTNNTLNLTLSPNFNIPAGQLSTGPNSYFQWDAATVISAPQADDPD